MKQFLKYYCLSSLLVALVACEKEADIPLPDAPVQLVVYSYISPSDSLIVVDLSRSAPFFGDNQNDNIYDPITDAIVNMSSGDSSIQLQYDAVSLQYTAVHNSDFPINEGQSYALTVSTPDGLSCSSKTTVPVSQPNTLRFELDSALKNNNGYQEKQYRIRGIWNDAPNVSNYYHFNVELYSGSPGSGYSICNEVFTDEGKDGEEMSTTCTHATYYDSTFPNSSTVEGKIYLLVSDYSYYRYHESYYRYEDDNPFAEPVRIYSNIDGGLGCFGSYLKQSILF